MENYDEPSVIREIDNNILSQTFFRMFMGLLASAIVAFGTYQSGAYVKLLTSGTYVGLAILEIVMVLVFSLAFKHLSSTVVTILFYGYAAVNGITLSTLFAIYELNSMGYCFLATAIMFGILSYVAKNTKKDLTKLGEILPTFLLVGIVLSIVNIFAKSSLLDIILNWAVLAIFVGLTVWDIKKIAMLQAEGICEDEKLYVYGAMELYLDFINMFLRILRLFGKRRN